MEHSSSSNIPSSSENLSMLLPVVFVKLCFITPIIRSKNPPHHGARDRLNFQRILRVATYFISSSSLVHLVVTTIFLPLSLIMTFLVLLLATNSFKVHLDSSAIRYLHNVRCTALVVEQVKRATYAFASVVLFSQ